MHANVFIILCSKRGVNKKVLKVPSTEQKVLDATSKESWAPHGTHLADIAQASRN
ncbi:putative ENTH domain-containing protein [Helianthus debilis subsp. tardiflorus]